MIAEVVVPNWVWYACCDYMWSNSVFGTSASLMLHIYTCAAHHHRHLWILCSDVVNASLDIVLDIGTVSW